MNKMTTAALAGLVAISGLAQASASRQNGFGTASEFISDVQRIWTLPAVTASNADATYFEFGSAPFGLGGSTVNDSAGQGTTPGNAGQAWGGVHMGTGIGVLGIWANRPYTNFNTIGDMPATGFVNPALTGTNPVGAAALSTLTAAGPIVHKLDIIYGIKVSDMLSLGIGINTSGATGDGKVETTVAAGTTAGESNQGGFGINVGADIAELGPIALLEIGLQYDSLNSMTSSKSSLAGFSGTNKNTRVGSDINLRIGADIKGDGGAFQRIEIQFMSESLETKSEADGNAVTPVYNSLKRTGGGWGVGWASGMSSDKGMGLGGVILTGGSTSNTAPFALQRLDTGAAIAGPITNAEVNKNEQSNMNVLFVSAGEAKVKEWLMARAGLQTSLFGTMTKSYEVGAVGATTKTTTTGSPAGGATLSTGLGLIFGDITIDGTLNQDFLYSGPFFSNGMAEQLFGQVSATWAWGGTKE